MEQVNPMSMAKVITRSERTSSTQSRITGERPTSDFTEHEKDITGYVWVRFKAVWSGKFGLVWATEKEVKISKREYARNFGKYTRAQVDEAIEYCKHQLAQGEKEYLEPNPLVLLRVLGQLNTNKAMYKHSGPALPPPPEVKHKRKKAAAAGIERLKGIFDD